MSDQHCQACHVGMPTYDEQAIEKALADIEGWAYNQESQCIYKSYSFKTYSKTMFFVNAIAWIAMSEKHHPDLQVSYNQVVVSYQTHEAGGITDNDFICARKVEALCDA